MCARNRKTEGGTGLEREGRQLLSLSIQEEREFLETLDNLAQAEGVSRAEVIRKLLRLGLRQWRLTFKRAMETEVEAVAV